MANLQSLDHSCASCRAVDQHGELRSLDPEGRPSEGDAVIGEELIIQSQEHNLARTQSFYPSWVWGDEGRKMDFVLTP